MSEPSLEDISDYNNLDTEKRRVIFAIIFSCLIMGVIYAFASNVYDNKEDTIEVEKTLKIIPMK